MSSEKDAEDVAKFGRVGAMFGSVINGALTEDEEAADPVGKLIGIYLYGYGCWCCIQFIQEISKERNASHQQFRMVSGQLVYNHVNFQLLQVYPRQLQYLQSVLYKLGQTVMQTIQDQNIFPTTLHLPMHILMISHLLQLRPTSPTQSPSKINALRTLLGVIQWHHNQNLSTTNVFSILSSI